MAKDELTFRIPGFHDFWAQASREAITANTTLLDAFDADAGGEILLHGWSSKVFEFFMKLLQCDDYALDDFLDEFEAEVKDIWSIASFHEKYVRQPAACGGDDTETSEPGRITLRMREWFRRWWDDNGEGFRGADAEQLTTLVMPAFYIGDAQVFMSVTHDWFLHVSGKQATTEHAIMPVDSDYGGREVLDTRHPLLGKLAAARANMIGKIEDALPYDEKRDGCSKWLKCENPDWCPKLKSAAYYKALKATGCWPVGPVARDFSIHQVLTKLADEFDYVNYDDMPHMPNRVAAHVKMPDPNGVEIARRCMLCVNPVIKFWFNDKIKSLIKTLLDEKTTLITIERQGKDVTVEVDDSFAGLCLDCLTKTKFGCEDEDYWNHCLDFEYDRGCTVAHGQPTWYFSYLGRPWRMKQYQKRMKAQLQTKQRGGR